MPPWLGVMDRQVKQGGATGVLRRFPWSQAIGANRHCGTPPCPGNLGLLNTFPSTGRGRLERRMQSSRTGTVGRDSARRGARGFTVLELLIVLLVVSLILAIATQRYGVHLERTAARQAAQLFAQDLGLTRTSALRDRQPASLTFLAGSRDYVIEVNGVEVARRSYGALSQVRLSMMELTHPPGSSVTFNARGIVDLGTGATLGRAQFEAGTTAYEVRFNSMGATAIAEVP